mgnify:CR=1 FL=1
MANKPKDEKSGVSAIPSRVSKFVRDQKSEIKKIVWPGKKQVVNNTAVVIGFVLVAAVVVGFSTRLWRQWFHCCSVRE